MKFKVPTTFLLLSALSLFGLPANADDNYDALIKYFDFKGLITETNRYPSGNISDVTIYTPPSVVPGRKNAFAVQTYFVTYDVVTYKPRSPITETFIVDCSLGTLTTIIRFTTFLDKNVNTVDDGLNAKVSSFLKKYGGNAMTQVRALEVVNRNVEGWSTPQSIAYAAACKK